MQVQQAKDRESAMQAHVMAVDKQYTALYAQSQQVHQTCQTSIASLKLLQEENIKLKQEVVRLHNLTQTLLKCSQPQSCQHQRIHAFWCCKISRHQGAYFRQYLPQCQLSVRHMTVHAHVCQPQTGSSTCLGNHHSCKAKRRQ